MAILHDGKYKRIGYFEASFTGAGFINVMLEVYNSKEDRDKTKQGIEYLVKYFEGVSLDSTAFDVFDVTEAKDIREAIYKKIKEKDEYKDAKDV